jgi:hypothetical protein
MIIQVKPYQLAIFASYMRDPIDGYRTTIYVYFFDSDLECDWAGESSGQRGPQNVCTLGGELNPKVGELLGGGPHFSGYPAVCSHLLREDSASDQK